MAGKFVLNKAKDGQFYFNLKASNGEIILTSEMYKAKPSAKNGIESVKKNSGEEKQYSRLTSKNGKEYFVLKAKNQQIIGQSQMYSDARSRDNGVKSVMNNGPGAAVDDQTVA